MNSQKLVVYYGNSNYLNNWVLHYIIGPEKMYYNTNFKNLKQNAYKQNLDKEIKRIEEDVDNGGKCPKYFKTYVAFPNAIMQAIENITDDEYNNQIKANYLTLGGIWITNPTESKSTENTEDSEDAEDAGQTTYNYMEHLPLNPDKVGINSKYSNLWDKAVYMYLPTKFSKLGWEYDGIWYDNNKPIVDITNAKNEITHEAFIFNGVELKVCINKKLNPDWPYKALYIDTIKYNYWQKTKEDLEALAVEYSKLPDKTKPSDSTDPKRQNGEDYEPVCDKYYPLDYQEMLGLPALLPPLMTVPVVDYYMYDNTVNFVMDSNEYDGFLLNQGDDLNKAYDALRRKRINDLQKLADYYTQYVELSELININERFYKVLEDTHKVGKYRKLLKKRKDKNDKY